MTTAYTSLLGLALPVTGELSGTWGDTVNNSITSLLDSAIAGTQTLTADTTLTTTTGAANQSRQAILLCSPASANITITAPAQSKIYTVINTSATYTVTVRGVGPTTGVTIATSESAVIAWNGTDFIRISSNSTFTAPVVIEGTTTSAALRITQLGTGNALLVEDSTNPDSTPFVINSTGQVVVGDTSLYTSAGVTGSLQVTGSSADSATIAVNSFRNSANGPFLTLSHSKSGVNGTQTALVQNDAVGLIRFSGSDGTAFIQAAAIDGYVDGTPGTNDMPGRLVFSTTADGASSPTERMRIDSAGRVGINGTPSANSGIIRFLNNATGSTVVRGIINDMTVQSDVTIGYFGFRSQVNTAAATFTLNTMYHFVAAPSTFGAGSTVTNQYGFFADLTLTGATNNYGFFSNIASGTGRYNFYANGTAENFFGGNTVVSVTDNTNAALRITQLGTGNALLVEDSTNPDSTPFVIDASGNVVIGTTSPTTTTYPLFVESTAGIFTSCGSNTAATSPAIATSRRRTGLASVNSGDSLGKFSSFGWDGSSSIEASRIEAAVDGTPGTNDMPGRLIFSTTADGASTPTEHVRITSAGKTGFATAAPAATVHVAGDTILSNVNVLGASYDSVSFSVAAEETVPSDLFFSPDGLKMYIIGSTGDDVNEYNLSTAWVVSSAVFVTNFSVASQETVPTGLFFRADGTKMYIVGHTNDTVFQYTLSTPWSVATASYDSVSFSVGGQDTLPNGIWFKPNGLSMYMVGATGDAVYQYTLSTAWNVSTATFLQSFSIGSQESIPNAVTFTGDGSRMFLMGQSGDDVNVYNLTTPWDISTSAFVNVFSVAGQDIAPQGLYIKPDGTKMYMVGSTNDAVYQYTVPSIDIQLTGPTSVAALDVQQDLYVYGNTQVYKISASSVATFSAGTVALPAITTTGDTNTGIFFPAADTVGVSTGGSERMRIDTAGNVGIGSTSLATARLYVTNTVTDTVNSESAVYSIMTANNASGSNIKIGNRSSVLTGASFAGTGILNAFRADMTYSLASAFTGSLQGFRTSISNSGAGAINSIYGFASTAPSNTGGGSITNYYGFAQDDVTTATAVYGFLGSVTSGANKWNLYMSGTANNYLAGRLGIGSGGIVDALVPCAINPTGATTMYGFRQFGTVQSDVTGSWIAFQSTLNTAASAFTIINVNHFLAGQTSIGATSAVTNQYGFQAQSNLTGATNNYGFHSNIASGTGRWNFYAAGTADNYFAGNVGIGTSSPGYKLDITGTTRVNNGALSVQATGGIALPSTGYGWEIYNVDSSTNYLQSYNRTGSAFMNSVYNALSHQFYISGAERMRIDSSGNVGIGVTPAANFGLLQVNTATNGTAAYLGNGAGIHAFNSSGYYSSAVTLSSAGAWTARSSGSGIISPTNSGTILFYTDTGLTSGNTFTPTERMRIDTVGNMQMQAGAVMPYAPAPASISTTATLTNANIQAQIINTTGTSYTVTMPLGTTLETLATWATTNVAYDFFVINTASGTITMAVNTGVTSLGTLTIATGVSAQFRIRRTAANTFVLYRLG